MLLFRNWKRTGPAPHTLVFPVPVRWQPVPRDVPIALQTAAVVAEPSEQEVAIAGTHTILK